MNARRDSEEPRPRSRRLGLGMIVAAWVLLLGLLTAWFSGWLDAQRNPNREVSGHVAEGGVREVVLQQNRQGHYVATGSINDASVRFLLDTGATTVSVPEDLARELDLSPGAPSPTQTANGVVMTYPTVLDRVRLGNIELRDVRAHINPGMRGGGVLLGMSFLKQLEMIQRGDSLTLRQHPPSS